MVVLAISPAQAEVDEIRRTPAADWLVAVERGSIDDKLLGQISDGTYFLLSDLQVSVEGGRDVYRRYASKAINAAGVDSLATIEIGFDPAYQTLDLNSIDLIRHGQTISKLAAATLRVLQRETELDRRIYDGSKSATIFLEDVRVGDIVDYSYTVHGRNPVFEDREFGSMGLRFGVPLARIHARLLASAKRDLRIVARNSHIEARVRAHDGTRTCAPRCSGPASTAARDADSRSLAAGERGARISAPSSSPASAQRAPRAVRRGRRRSALIESR